MWALDSMSALDYDAWLYVGTALCLCLSLCRLSLYGHSTMSLFVSALHYLPTVSAY
jgi:hypothetical protein